MPDGSGTGGKENLRVGRYLGRGRYLVFHRGGSGAGLRFLYVSVWEGKFAILCASRLGPAKRIGWAGGVVGALSGIQSRLVAAVLIGGTMKLGA